MATRDDFTDEEWDRLHRGVTGSGLLVSVSDRSLFDGFKEAGALARHLVDARRSGDSTLVRDLAATRGTGFGLTASPEEVERETLAALRDASTLLSERAPGEFEAYRTLVLEVAESVARAAGGGDAAEGAAVGRIRSALGTPAA